MPTSKILPGILAVVPAAMLLTTQASSSEPAAETCRASPGASTPRGAHWYYRIKPGDKRHCWYLGVTDAHANARAASQPAATPAATPQATNVGDAEPTAPAPDADLETAPAQMAAPPAPPAEEALTPVSFLEWSAHDADGSPEFAARWPDELPDARDLDQSDLAEAATSYAERQTPMDNSAQMPSRWPLTEAIGAQQLTAGETALRAFSLAGILAIALLLLAGWSARFLRGRGNDRSQNRGAWRALARTPLGDARRWPATPTDPAEDLKKSLAELMRDLRRAAAACETPRAPARVANRSPARALPAAAMEEAAG